jgi:predicted AAA+ superfamily ATPase
MLSPFTTSEKRGEGGVPPWSELLQQKTAAEVVEFSSAEQKTSNVNWRREILRGGMPRAVLSRTNRERTMWFDGYISTYLERDLRDLTQVTSLPDFRRLMKLSVNRIGQLLNQSDLARDAGMPQATAHRYLNLLETTFQTHRLQAYWKSPTKRLIKAPKLYWRDCGLAAHMAGLGSMRELNESHLLGSLLENLVLSSLLTWRETTSAKADICYWRTAGGAEVDFVIETPRRLLPVEVKAAKRVRLGDLKHLDNFLADYRTLAPFGIVLHDVDRPHVLTKRIVGMPVADFI